jgi:hypothetical protein
MKDHQGCLRAMMHVAVAENWQWQKQLNDHLVLDLVKSE